VKVTADSWYRFGLTCGTPLGCPSTPSTYPAGTRHVGVQLGSEESRSYLQLGLSALPADKQLVSGHLTVPLLDVTAGTLTPENANVLACLSYDPVLPSDGAYSKNPPEAACGAASAKGTYVVATGSTPAALVFDISTIARLWQTSVVPGSLVLLPAPGPALTDAWHVAFSASSGSGPKPTATLRYTSSTPAAPLPDLPEAPSPDPIPTPSALPGLEPGPVPAVPTVPEPGPTVAPAPGTGQQAGELVPVSVVLPRFRYPAVFLLPLLLAAVGWWVARSLTREV
jgi:hypothetical protein